MKTFLTILFLWFLSANAATYYVSTTGSDGAAGGSSTPWLTLAHAEAVAVAGDIVNINNGSYAGFTASHSGSSGNVITFQAVNPGAVSLTSTLTISGNYRTFNDLNFNNISDRAIYINGANNIVNRPTININFTTGYGIILGADANTGGSSADNNIVDGARIIGSATGTIHGVIYGGGGDGNQFRNSYVSNTYYGFVDKSELNTKVYNNVFNMTASGLNCGIYSKGATGGNYFNNDIRAIGSGHCIILNQTDAPELTASTGGVIKNNIFIKNSTDATIFDAYPSGNTYTSDYNLFNYSAGVVVIKQGVANYSSLATWVSASGQDAHSVAATPVFTNASGTFNQITDYKPTSGSPVVNAGVTISGRTTDAAGLAMNGTPDIGAYEYQAVTGSIYYVSTTGNDANPGTIGSPWAVTKLSTVTLAPGDIVYIRAGTYTMGSGNSPQYNVLLNGKNGNAGNPITIAAYPGDFGSGGRVVFDMSGFAYTSNHFGVYIQNSSYLTIKGIRVTNIPQRQAGQVCVGWWVNGNAGGNITLENCEADHIGNTGFRLDNTNNATFLNCDAHHIDNPYDPGVQQHGGSDGFGRYDPSNTSDNTLYKNCRAWFCSDDAWDCFGSPGTITYDGDWAFWSGYVQDVFPLSHSSGGVNWGDGNGIKLGSGTTPQDFANTKRIIRRCFAFQNYKAGFDQNEAKIKMEFYNNTSYQNGYGYQFYPTGGAAPMTARNNIAYLNTTNQNFITANTTQSNNSWNTGFTPSGSDFASTSNTGVDGARQADGSLPSLTFMNLASSSQYIDAGVIVPAVIYNGSAPDIGAFESGSVAVNNPPTPNAGPDQTIQLPITAVTLTATVVADTTISSYLWELTGFSPLPGNINGPTDTIVTPSAIGTDIIGLSSGSYTFRITVTDANSLTGYSTIIVTVLDPDNPAETPSRNIKIHGIKRTS